MGHQLQNEMATDICLVILSEGNRQGLLIDFTVVPYRAPIAPDQHGGSGPLDLSAGIHVSAESWQMLDERQYDTQKCTPYAASTLRAACPAPPTRCSGPP